MKPKTNTNRTNLFAIILMLILVPVVFLFAVGYNLGDMLKTFGHNFFGGLRSLFYFRPFRTPADAPAEDFSGGNASILVPSSVVTYSTAIDAQQYPDLELGQPDAPPDADLVEEETPNLDKTQDEAQMQTLDQTSDEVKEDGQLFQQPEKQNNLYNTIEYPTKTVGSPISTTSEQLMDTIPIDESDISSETKGWCFFGSSTGGARGCAPIGQWDKCVSGEVYATQMECLKI